MSADNGIYILSTTCSSQKLEGSASWVKCTPYKVYRVAYAQGIDNFHWYNENQLYNLGAYMLSVWGKSKKHTDLKDAYLEATEIAKNYPYLEYGISTMETDMRFFNDY